MKFVVILVLAGIVGYLAAYILAGVWCDIVGSCV